jgi:hypothetical protein
MVVVSVAGGRFPAAGKILCDGGGWIVTIEPRPARFTFDDHIIAFSGQQQALIILQRHCEIWHLALLAYVLWPGAAR